MIRPDDLPSDNILIDMTPYKVEVVGEGLMSNDLGQWCYGPAQLRVSPDQTLPNLADTIMHEVLHALVRVRCCGILEKEAEEQLVSHLAAGMLQIIRDNIDWIDWMYKILDDQSRRCGSQPQP